MEAPAWSATRGRIFQECRRKYYYRYHLAPAGRRPGAAPEAQEAARVCPLLGLEAWTGEVVHEWIASLLGRWRAGIYRAEAEETKEAVELLRRRFRQSREFWSGPEEAFPRRPPLLDLHYFDEEPLDRERGRELRARVETCVRELLRSELAARIQAASPARWLPIDRNAAAHLPDGTLLRVRPDFAFRDGALLHILDWKTGEKSDPHWDRVQVTVYALYASEKWEQPLARVAPAIVRLYPNLHLSDAEYGPETLESVREYIRWSHAQIVEATGGEALPPIERFPCAADPVRCRRCCFRRLCDGAAGCGAAA